MKQSGILTGILEISNFLRKPIHLDLIAKISKGEVKAVYGILAIY